MGECTVGSNYKIKGSKYITFPPTRNVNRTCEKWTTSHHDLFIDSFQKSQFQQMALLICFLTNRDICSICHIMQSSGWLKRQIVYSIANLCEHGKVSRFSYLVFRRNCGKCTCTWFFKLIDFSDILRQNFFWFIKFFL